MSTAAPLARLRPGEKLDVEVATSPEERERIYRFRYQTLVRDMAWGSSDADHDAGSLSDPLDAQALHLFISWQGIVIGSARLVLGAGGKLPETLGKAMRLERFADFPEEALSFTDRLMVAPAWQGSQVTALLLGAAYKMARGHASRFDFTHCGPALIEFYEQLGYRRYGENFNTADGYRVPLVLLTEDMRHLEEVNSPLTPLAAASGGNDPGTAGWFAERFLDHAVLPRERTMDEDRFWSFLTTKLHQTPLVGIPILSGLTYDEARRFLKVGTVLVCKDGDAIVRAGDENNEMFVVLSGEVEVRAPVGQWIITTLGRGTVFGEMALLSAEPRSANVVARGTVELLILSEEMLRRTMKTMPDVSAKVLFGLSLVLCKRLRSANNRWLSAMGNDDAQGSAWAEAAKEDDDIVVL